MSNGNENEPEEYDPESHFQDESSDSITIPSVQTEPEEVPPRIRYTFWIIVFTLKVALIATSVGILLLAFGYDATIGFPVLAIGILSFLLAFRLSYQFYRDNPEEGEETDNDTIEPEVE